MAESMLRGHKLALNHIALRKTKIVHVYNFCLSECNMVKMDDPKKKMRMAELLPLKMVSFTRAWLFKASFKASLA